MGSYGLLWVLIFFVDVAQPIRTYLSDPFSQQSESRAEERIINIIILNKKTRPVEVSFSIVLAERLLATLVQPARQYALECTSKLIALIIGAVNLEEEVSTLLCNLNTTRSQWRCGRHIELTFYAS